jgi:Ala-tRNA(Pro) deacylase
MQCKERLEAYLREHQVPFQLQRHAQTFSAQKIAESEHIPSKMVAKTVIVWADNDMVALVLCAADRADLAQVRSALGAKDVYQAQENEFADTFPDCEVGSMPPFGNLYGIPVYVERHLAEQETMVFPVGTYTETMSLKYADFERLVQPKVIAFAEAASLA